MVVTATMASVSDRSIRVSGRFFTPEETLRITGVRPQNGPPLLVGELAGNACSPLLLSAALRRIMPDALKHGPLAQHMRSAWLRKLGMSILEDAPAGPFPEPIDATIFIRKGNVESLRRIQSSASMLDLYVAASLLSDLDTDAFPLRTLDGLSIHPSSPMTAGIFYGNTLYIHQVA